MCVCVTIILLYYVCIQIKRVVNYEYTDLLSKFLVLGSKRLAVSTPRSVEFNKDIFCLVVYNLIEVLTNYNLRIGIRETIEVII